MVTVVQLRGNPEWINVKDFGAKGDGVNDDTDAIRNAINATLDATPAKPAILYFPRGTYRTRPLYMTSNCLWLGDGIDRTIIKRIADPNDDTTWTYEPIVYSRYTYTSVRSFIKPRRAHSTNGNEVNFGMKDLTIDASGYDWEYTPKNVTDNRPAYQQHNSTIDCPFMKNLYFENLKIIDSMNWHLVFRDCDNVYLTNIIIDGDSQRQAYNYNDLSDPSNWGMTQPDPNDLNPPPHAGKRRWNQDGIDIMSSSNVFASNLKIFSQDDCIAISNEYLQVMSNIHINNADLRLVGNGRNIILHYSGRETQSTTDQVLKDIMISNVICRSASASNVLISPQPDSTYTAAPNTTKSLINVILDNIYFPPQLSSMFQQNINLALNRGFDNNPTANIVQIVRNLFIRSVHDTLLNHYLIMTATPKVASLDQYYVLQNCVFSITARCKTAGMTIPALCYFGYASNLKVSGIIRRETSTYSSTIRLVDYIKNLDLTDLVIFNENFELSGGEPALRFMTSNIENILLPEPTKLGKTHFVGTTSGVSPPNLIYFETTNRQNAPTVTEQTTSPFSIINTSKAVQILYISRSGSITSWEISTDGGLTWSTQTIALPSKLILMPNMGIRITFNPTSIRLFTILYPT